MTDPTLAALLADVESARARLHAYLRGEAAGTSSPIEVWPADPSDPDLISVSVAAERCGGDASTVRRWCRDFGIGRQYGTRWRVSVSRMRAHLSA